MMLGEINGSVAWYNYLGATVTGGIIGGAIGAGTEHNAIKKWLDRVIRKLLNGGK